MKTNKREFFQIHTTPKTVPPSGVYPAVWWGNSAPQNMAAALLKFMETGNPNGGGLPDWPRYTTEKGETMILDDTPKVRNDPDRKARKVLPA